MFCADVFNKEEETHSYNFHILSTWGCNTFEELKDRENKFVHFIPCWSLTALLSVLNFPSLTQNKENKWEVCVFDHDNDDYIEKTASNPVDACYEMILKLNELNLL